MRWRCGDEGGEAQRGLRVWSRWLHCAVEPLDGMLRTKKSLGSQDKDGLGSQDEIPASVMLPPDLIVSSLERRRSREHSARMSSCGYRATNEASHPSLPPTQHKSLGLHGERPGTKSHQKAPGRRGLPARTLRPGVRRAPRGQRGARCGNTSFCPDVGLITSRPPTRCTFSALVSSLPPRRGCAGSALLYSLPDRLLVRRRCDRRGASRRGEA